MTKINIQHIAKLANLALKKDEEEKFEAQLSAVLEHVEKLANVDVSKVTETSQVTGLENVERNDTVSPSLIQEEATSQAQQTHNGFFEVPVIIEEAVE